VNSTQTSRDAAAQLLEFVSQSFCQSPQSIMQCVLIIHEVENYDAWKRIFDHAADMRKVAGERTYQVLKYENDPNKIVHFSAWTSIDAAKEFFESPQLVKIRADAGVKSPEFIYLDQLESGTL
jgi:quinol monooxygenase YgiN